MLDGIGPGPFCATLLSDMGAHVLRIDREGFEVPDVDLPSRGRRSVVLDLKAPEGLATALSLIDKADVLVEGFRPGVMERLGLGPEESLRRNPHLVYGRMTFTEVAGQVQPAPASRFWRTPGAIQGSPPMPGEGGAEALRQWGGEPA